jgi:secreted trypsin-like serine protease
VCSLRTATADNSNFLYCGCSLVAPGVVLTAAHCVMDLRTPWVEVRAGSKGPGTV